MRDFNHSVNVLVKAYLNDTLNKKLCTACAVGNLIADHRGTKQKKIRPKKIKKMIVRFDNNQYADGSFATQWFRDMNLYRYYKFRGVECPDFDITEIGYTIAEVSRIEGAFENAKGDNQDLQEFNGLMAVVDVLADIHKIDLTTREESKKLFIKV